MSSCARSSGLQRFASAFFRPPPDGSLRGLLWLTAFPELSRPFFFFFSFSSPSLSRPRFVRVGSRCAFGASSFPAPRASRAGAGLFSPSSRRRGVGGPPLLFSGSVRHRVPCSADPRLRPRSHLRCTRSDRGFRALLGPRSSWVSHLLRVSSSPSLLSADRQSARRSPSFPWVRFPLRRLSSPPEDCPLPPRHRCRFLLHLHPVLEWSPLWGREGYLPLCHHLFAF